MNSIDFADTLIARVAVAVVISMLLCYRSLREARDWSKTEAAGAPLTPQAHPSNRTTPRAIPDQQVLVGLLDLQA
ncbi:MULTISPECIES: hypothetical protein [unclassified Rhizobium]|uniref:hypothetical protein n=1 Tax=unclassified Rhizobium TaxID=2613769 RepID=UPI001047B0DB|nr:MULTISPECIES: hypothetical protein [unclassified Rhizobium]MBB3395154.1 hypothetical protein [Rhizobium sp. BK060]TCM78038.1 hypothetical protein EV291_106207 [Rhizobium sp. BK068]